MRMMSYGCSLTIVPDLTLVANDLDIELSSDVPLILAMLVLVSCIRDSNSHLFSIHKGAIDVIFVSVCVCLFK